MGQCLGVEALREDLKAFTAENESLTTEVTALQSELLSVQRYFIKSNEDRNITLRRIFEQANKNSSNSDRTRQIIANQLLSLQYELVSLHREEIDFASAFGKVAFDMNSLILALSTYYHPRPSSTKPSSASKSEHLAIEAVSEIDDSKDIVESKKISKTVSSGSNWKKSMKRASTMMTLSRKSSQRVVGFDDPQTNDNTLRIDTPDYDDDNDGNSPSHSPEKGSLLKRSATLPNLKRSMTFEELQSFVYGQNKIGETVTVTLQKGETLGLVAYPYKRVRSGDSYIAQLIVGDYVSNGIDPNRSYMSGILIDDVICGVNGKFYSDTDDLAKALVLACGLDDGGDLVNVDLSITFRGSKINGLSNRRMLHATEMAKLKLKTTKAVKAKPKKSSSKSNDLDGGDGTHHHHHHGHHGVHHVRKDDSPVNTVKSCVRTVWKLVINSITTKSFRKAIGKNLRKYCCKSGFGEKKKKELNKAMSSRHGFRDVHADREYNADTGNSYDIDQQEDGTKDIVRLEFGEEIEEADGIFDEGDD